MFLPGFRDLVRPQWVAIVEELRVRGSMPVPELAQLMGMSYMGVKQHCESLHKLGYLERTRVPRTEVGRPEISYRLAPKADALFPQAGVALSLGLLQQVKQLFGNNAPEKLLYQYFQDLHEQWQGRVQRAKSLVEKATVLASLREKEGCFSRCSYDVKQGFRMEEFHHPMWALFEHYPAAVLMELRMMEQLLGTKIERRVVPGGRGGPARVEFCISTL